MRISKIMQFAGLSVDFLPQNSTKIGLKSRHFRLFGIWQAFFIDYSRQLIFLTYLKLFL